MNNYSNYLVTISAFKKNIQVSERELYDTHDQLMSKIKRQYEVVNYVHEKSGKYEQLHSHAILRIYGFFRYKFYTKIGKFKIDWKRLPMDTDLHKAQDYISKDQYDKMSEASPPN